VTKDGSMRKLFFLMSLAAMAAFAADVTGSWKGSMETPMGTIENTFVLKADGANLSGSIQSQMGELKIEKGKIDGDKITFSASMEMGTLTYSGVVNGDEIKLTITFGDMPGMDMLVKRVK
jgi:hypothetical protein